MAYLILKDTIQDAFNKGEVLYFLEQTDFKRGVHFPDLAKEDDLDKIDDLSEGICAGLALHWLSLRYNGRDFPTQLVTLDESSVPPKRSKRAGPMQVPFVNAAIRQAVINQLIVQRIARSSVMFLSYVDAVMTSQYGIAVNRKAFRRKAGTVNAAFLKDEMERSGDGLYYVGMRRPDGGHAVTFQHEDGVYRFFDGNSGGYSFKSRDRMFAFFQAYIDDWGYPRRCTEATWVGKIEPLKRTSHHDQLEWFKRRSRGLIDLPGSRVPMSGFRRDSGHAGRTPAFIGAM